MDYVCPVEELEQRLKEAGEQLAFPPSSTNDLLDLLDKTEQLLTFVGQAPSISMQGALVPSMGALISDGLLKHSELDVKISVASCLCEVARITAPKPPYRDEIMKEIFQLNMLAFGQLSNITSQTYHKAVHILELVSKVKSCLLMLDLECDALVLEMFKQFLGEIRINHPQTVFSDIEAIMTITIKESDEISTDLISLLISHLKKESQIVTPASWKIAENVTRNCKDVFKSYYKTIMKLINSNLDDYAEVVTVLCQNAHENDHMVTRSTRTNSTQKRDLNTLENGGPTKKQKDADKNQSTGNDLETPRRGRPKKNKNILNQDNSSNSVQNSQENTRRTRFQEKRQSSNTKGNIGNSGSLYNVVVKKEDESLSDYEGSEPSTQQTINIKKQRRRKPSSNTRDSNGSRGKEIPKKWGQDLVGHRIQVWWPLDKMYYEGAVSSYNSLDQKHKVLYADGDEEVLDLHNEKWMMLDEILPNQQKEQVADLSSPKSTPGKRRKSNRKRILKSSIKQDNSNSPKSSPPADSSKSVDAICNADSQNNDLFPPPADSSKTADVVCNADNQNNNPVSTPADSSKTADVACNADNQNNNPVSMPADSSKTADVVCNADNQNNNPVSMPADSSKTADVVCNADNQNNNPVSTPADSSKTADVVCNVDNQNNNPLSIPADSSKTADVVCNADNQDNNPVPTPADSSKTADVICNADNQNLDFVSPPADSPKTADDNHENNLVSTPGVSCGIKLTEKETDDMAKNDDPDPDGDLEEKKPDESSENTHTENLNCEI